MKKMLCLLLCLTLIFSSVSLSFAATQDVSDAQTHTILGNLYNLLNGSDFKGRLNNIFNKLTDINANIVTLMGWIDPSSGNSTAGILNNILNMLAYTDTGGAIKSWLADIWQVNAVNLPMLTDLSKALSNYFYMSSNLSAEQIRRNSHYSLINSTGDYSIRTLDTSGGDSSLGVNWTRGTPLGNIALILLKFNNSYVNYSRFLKGSLTTNYDSSQTFTNWTDLISSTFTPSSISDGLYKWLSNIQTPVARLSYVLASDERIEAQEAAAANEEAVVDNFIDSSGDGSASPSDIGSVSDLSSGYKQNFGSDASVSGIFNIFDSNNMGWFSQETKNQLDTTSNNRMTKSQESETPLLDKQIKDIYDALGVKQP